MARVAKVAAADVQADVHVGRARRQAVVVQRDVRREQVVSAALVGRIGGSARERHLGAEVLCGEAVSIFAVVVHMPCRPAVVTYTQSWGH